MWDKIFIVLGVLIIAIYIAFVKLDIRENNIRPWSIFSYGFGTGIWLSILLSILFGGR